MKVACALLPDFEVAVELSRHPELAGRPVVVGGLPHERKSVLSCSPEAAAFGITAGIMLRKAAGLCPEAVFLPSDERLYQTIMTTVLETMDGFSPKVEVTGRQGDGETGRRGEGEPGRGRCPELRTQNSEPRTRHSSLVVYLDASGLELLFGPDEELGERIAAAVEVRAGLRPRVGVGSSKFVAHMAAIMAPAGSVVVVRPSEERSFLAPLPVEWLPFSQEMQRRLRLFGLRTMGQLAGLPAGALGEQFGPEGMEAARLARGVDERPVIGGNGPAFLREEIEIDPPTDRSDLLTEAVRHLVEILEAQMQGRYLACREVALDLGFADWAVVHLSTALHEPTDRAADLQRAAERLLGRVWAQLSLADREGEGDGEGEAPAEPPRDGQPTCLFGTPFPESASPLPTWRLGRDPRPPDSDPSPEGALSFQPDGFSLGRTAAIDRVARGTSRERAQREGPQAPPPYGADDFAPRVSLLRLSISGFGGHHGEQLELFGSRAAALKKVQRAVQQAEELFGDDAIDPMTAVAGEKPMVRRIKVIAEVEGQPRALFLDGRREKVREVSNRWRVQEEWWRRERMREYYRVITESGRLCLIFQDLLGGSWFIERIYD